MKLIWEIREDPYNSIRNREVVAFFREANDKRKEYIASLLKAVFIFQLTHLDPTCAEIVKAEIPSDGVLYLDTNFIFRLIGLQGPDLFIAAKKLADASISLGYKLVFSPKTKNEYENTLRGFLQDVKRYPMITSELASLALDATSDEDFLTAYWTQVKNMGAYVDPEEYFDYYINIEQLLKPFNVILDSTFHEEILNTKSGEISSQATTLRSIMEHYFGVQSTDRVSPAVLEHDVYHRILILERRGTVNVRETFINTKYWFLTCDSKLPIYDRSIRSTKFNKMPFCVLSGQWFQTINPIVGSKEHLEQISADLIASPLLRAYQRPPSKLINSVIGRVGMRSTYSVPAVSAMLSNSQFLERYQNSENDIVKEDLLDSFYANYAVKTERELEDTKSDLEIIRAEKEKSDALAQQTAKELETIQREKAHEKIEKEEYKRALDKKSEENDITIKDFSQKANLLANETMSLKKTINLILILLITATWVIYFLLRKPLLLATNPAIEISVSVIISVYLFLLVYLGVWRSKAIVAFGIIVPVLFVLSFYVPKEFQTSLQLLDGIIALTVYLIDHFRK